jgi:predicted MFS family arabinose efflux permease
VFYGSERPGRASETDAIGTPLQVVAARTQHQEGQMMAIGRSVLAVLAGIVVAMILMVAVEMLSSHLFPLPPGVDLHSHESIRQHIDQLPIGAFLLVLIAWSVGSFAGSWVAARLAGRARLIHGLVIGAFFLAASIMNMLMIPHPLWMEIASIVALAGFSYLGARLAAGRGPQTPSQRLAPSV